MILVVDDDPAFRDAAQEALGGQYQVFVAANAAQAWQLALKRGFSAILIDLCLGQENGFSLIEELHHSFPKLPVIAISGALSRNTLESAMEFGAAGVLEKPISPDWIPAVADAQRRTTAGRP